jgi:hypothetical protein
MLDELLNKFRDRVSSLDNYTVKTAARDTVARSILMNPTRKSATALLMALRNIFGIDVLFWEPETIWLTLDKEGIDLPEDARNKVQAAISLIHNPIFFSDNLVFQRITKALNGEPFDPESLQECHPAHMAWAVYEASVIRGLDPETQAIPEIDEDVQQYIAVCLKRAGYIYPPDQLKVVEDNLLGLLPASVKSTLEDVKKSWAHLDKEALQDRTFLEDPLGVQLAQLASCYEYVKSNAALMATDVLEIEHAV